MVATQARFQTLPGIQAMTGSLRLLLRTTSFRQVTVPQADNKVAALHNPLERRESLLNRAQPWFALHWQQAQAWLEGNASMACQLGFKGCIGCMRSTAHIH